MNTDHLEILAGVCVEESFATILEAYFCNNMFYFVDELFMPYSIKGFRYISKYPYHICGLVTVKRCINIMNNRK